MHDTAFGSDGSLQVRLAVTPEDVRGAQALRYRIFYEEMGAHANPEAVAKGRDVDRFDDFCDHLLVTDLVEGKNAPRVVGTYRLLRRSVAERTGGFYSEDEYDVGVLAEHPSEILEVGRSCVDLNYRGRAVMQLLWQGIAGYVYRHQISLLFGCASLPGTEPATMRRALSYLHHHHLAPDHLRPRALPHRYVPMNQMPSDAIDTAAAWRELPPLIRGYLRLGGRVGEGAVVDPVFNTTDVCIVLETEQVTAKYLRHYQHLADQLGA